MVIDYAEKRRMVKARAVRRQEERDMRAAGFRRHETDWEINRGFAKGQVILEAKISADGRSVWTKVGWPEGAELGPYSSPHLFQQEQVHGPSLYEPNPTDIKARL